jgi:hypothetical protein
MHCSKLLSTSGGAQGNVSIQDKYVLVVKGKTALCAVVIAVGNNSNLKNTIHSISETCSRPTSMNLEYYTSITLRINDVIQHCL